MNDTILYFAYGSNLLQSRIHILNPSATFKDIGKIENYRLDFVGKSQQWKGSPATIVGMPNNDVWGTIWEIKIDQIKNLDKQEGVDEGLYRVLNMNIKNSEGNTCSCRVYQHTQTSVENLCDLSELPENKLPSLTYLKTIVKGAIDCGLPNEYICFLKKIKHNEYMDLQHPIGMEVCNTKLD